MIRICYVDNNRDKTSAQPDLTDKRTLLCVRYVLQDIQKEGKQLRQEPAPVGFH
jgi:hypothetical protein